MQAKKAMGKLLILLIFMICSMAAMALLTSDLVRGVVAVIYLIGKVSLMAWVLE